MRLIVLTAESAQPSEHETIAGLFALGLDHLHVRKPGWSCGALRAWLEAMPNACRDRLILHDHHELCDAFSTAGVHDSEFRARRTPSTQVRRIGIRSRAVHDVGALCAAMGRYDRLLLSPVFPSISKAGYGPDGRLDHGMLPWFLKKRPEGARGTEIFALGGVDAARVPDCRSLGFDGVAVLGAVWNTQEPLAAFQGLQAACQKEAP